MSISFATLVELRNFSVELGNLHRISNGALYLIHGVECSCSVNHDWELTEQEHTTFMDGMGGSVQSSIQISS